MEKLFEGVMKPYGDRWRPGSGLDEYEDQYTAMLLTFVRMAVKSQKRAYGPKGEIFCDFLRNRSFNALATTAEGYEFVAIFTGAISHVLAAHYCLLSDPAVLTTVGDPTQEKLSLDALDC